MRPDRNTQLLLPALVLSVLVGSIGLVDAGLYGAAALTRSGPALPENPFQAPFQLMTGAAAWTPEATGCAIAFALVIVAAVAIAAHLVRRRRGRRSRVDYRGQWMGHGDEIADLTERTVTRNAARLGIPDGSSPGVFLGFLVASSVKLYADFESVVLQIWGPRQGKTTTQVVPALIDAPGAAVSTSNKPDVVDATRGPRALVGRVWVFDPQQIANEEPTWWWNPLSYVTNDERAAKLAGIFADAGRDPGVKTDPYFDPAGTDLNASLLLAAALGGRPITDVYLWVAQASPSEPVQLLREHGFRIMADSLEAKINLSPDQKSGVFGTALEMLAALKFEQVQPWITRRSAADPRPHFDVHRFSTVTDTLYLLSKEGGGTCAALTTALTVAVAEAAEERAMRSPKRRLPVPLLLLLDEVANVCRWKELPSLYSHYGSKGIIPVSFLQSYAQGVELWGDSGMRKIFSASSVKVIGSGIDEERFNGELSRLIGEHRYDQVSESNARGGRTRSRNVDGGSEAILSIADIRSLPRGRMIVLRSGSRPALARSVPWSETRHAPAIQASIRRYEPQHEPAGTAKDARPAPAPPRPEAPAPAPAASANRWLNATRKENP